MKVPIIASYMGEGELRGAQKTNRERLRLILRQRESELEEIIQFDERGIDELAAEIQNAVDVAAEKSRFAPLKRIA